MNAPPVMTVTQALAYGTAWLGAAGRTEAPWLLSHVLGWPRSRLITQAAQTLTAAHQAHYLALLRRRQRGEPLAYLLGRWEFWSLELMISPAVLIPRPETELLVELALTHLPPQTLRTVADLGTGSGALALAVASERRACQVIATDCCRAALALAQTNARHLGLTNVVFRAGDWCAPLAGQRFDLILSNPPYVAHNDPHLEQLHFEPRLALSAGADGLAAMRLIVTQARAYLAPSGILLLEHGCEQGTQVRQLLAQRGYEKITTVADLEHRERVTLASNPD